MRTIFILTFLGSLSFPLTLGKANSINDVVEQLTRGNNSTGAAVGRKKFGKTFRNNSSTASNDIEQLNAIKNMSAENFMDDGSFRSGEAQKINGKFLAKQLNSEPLLHSGNDNYYYPSQEPLLSNNFQPFGSVPESTTEHLETFLNRFIHEGSDFGQKGNENGLHKFQDEYFGDHHEFGGKLGSYKRNHHYGNLDDYKGRRDKYDGTLDGYHGGYAGFNGHSDGYYEVSDGFDETSYGYEGRHKRFKGTSEGYGSNDGYSALTGYEGNHKRHKVTSDGYNRGYKRFKGHSDGYYEGNDGSDETLYGYEGSYDGFQGHSDGYYGGNDGFDETLYGYEGSLDGFKGTSDEYNGSHGVNDETLNAYSGGFDGYEGTPGGFEGSYDGHYESYRRNFGKNQKYYEKNHHVNNNYYKRQHQF